MSWAEDEGIDGYDPEMMFDPDIEDEQVWVGSEGILGWDEIDIEYLENIIRGLKTGKWESQAHKLERAERELANRRPKRWFEK